MDYNHYRPHSSLDYIAQANRSAQAARVEVEKAATRRYETRKSGADSSQGSSLSLPVAKRKTIEGFFNKP
jgi:hypothetical protein